MTTAWKKGDVVRLKSGGPAMTVADTSFVGVGDSRPRVLCTWFKKDEVMHGKFDAEMLESAADDDFTAT